MALSKDARRCVVFLGSQVGAAGGASIRPHGTAFFFDGGSVLGGGTYLVTARHVASKLDYPCVARLNNKDGSGARVLEIERAQDVNWYYPEDETVDLAVTPLAVPEWSDALAFSADHFATRREDGA